MLHNSQQSPFTQSLLGRGRDPKNHKTLTRSIDRGNRGFSAVAGLNSSLSAVNSSMQARTRKAAAPKTGESTPMRSGGSGQGRSDGLSPRRPGEMSGDSFSMKFEHNQGSDEDSDYGEEVSNSHQLQS